jgi:hypothetical protein
MCCPVPLLGVERSVKSTPCNEDSVPSNGTRLVTPLAYAEVASAAHAALSGAVPDQRKCMVELTWRSAPSSQRVRTRITFG